MGWGLFIKRYDLPFRRETARGKAAVMLIWALGIGGCASQYDFDEPRVDMRGVDEKAYATDFNQCVDRKMAAGVLFKSPTVSDCMRERGYTVIARK